MAGPHVLDTNLSLLPVVARFFRSLAQGGWVAGFRLESACLSAHELTLALTLHLWIVGWEALTTNAAITGRATSSEAV